jgi:hypothetical protein
MFRQQHMNALAEVIREDLKPGGTISPDGYTKIVTVFGRMLRMDNPRFNPSKWLRATMEENERHDERILRGIRRGGDDG